MNFSGLSQSVNQFWSRPGVTKCWAWSGSKLLSTLIAWVRVFRIIPEFRILRPTFHRKSASKCWIRFFDLNWDCLKTIDHFKLEIAILNGQTASLRLEFRKFRIFEILIFQPFTLSLLQAMPRDTVTIRVPSEDSDRAEYNWMRKVTHARSAGKVSARRHHYRFIFGFTLARGHFLVNFAEKRLIRNNI